MSIENLSKETRKKILIKRDYLRDKEAIAKMNLRKWKLMYERFKGKKRQQVAKNYSNEINKANLRFEKYKSARQKLEDYIFNGYESSLNYK